MKTPCSPSHSVRRTAAFTLIELLTTVGVIAALAALLLPAVNSARSKADAMQCLSNLRQLHVAYMQEVGDNDGALPWSYDFGKGTSWTEIYAESLGGNWQLADGGAKLASATGCPAQRRKLKLGGNRRTFAINISLTSDNSPIVEPGIPPKLGLFGNPSKTLLFADGPIKSATSTQNVCNSTDKFPDCLHNGRANAAFLDGHAEPLTQQQWNAMKGALPTQLNAVGTPLSIFWLGV